MPTNYIWLTLRAMFNRSSSDPSHRLRNFFIDQGVAPELSFMDITQPKLVIVSADLNTGKPILHGEDPEDKILDALLLSTALPPWYKPVKKQDRYLMDGGAVSNLPVEPALNLGATQIVALDLLDSRETIGEGSGFRGFLDRLIFTVEKRQLDLELALAEARRIPILYLGLTGKFPVPMWDFQYTDGLITQGYEIAQSAIENQRSTNPILASSE